MISSVSFSGKVYLTGGTANFAKKEEVRKMKEYADKNDCDVVVIDRDYYVDGTGKYEVILVQEDDECGKNFFDQTVFDFAKNKGFAHKPNFKYIPHAKLN